MIIVFGQSTATNTIEYCHVHIESEEHRLFKCSSKSCRTYVSNSKQDKVRATCQHLHLLYCLLNDKNGPPPKLAKGKSTRTETTVAVGTGESPSTSSEPDNATPLSRRSTLDAAMSRSLPYDIPISLIHNISKMDAASLLGMETRWPEIYEPHFSICPLCQTSMSNTRPHPGQSGKDSAYLLTELNPFKKIKFLVKICSNPSCKAMHQSNPIEIGKTTVIYV